MTNNIKVVVTNLGKYNEGELVYEWLDLPATSDEIQTTLDAIGINEEYEEYFISDYEAPFPIEEYSSLSRLNDITEELEGVTFPEKQYGRYDAEDVISFIYELEGEGLIDDAMYYVGDIVDDEMLDEMVKCDIENDAGWLRVRFFLQNADPNADYQLINGYGNADRLDSDMLKGIIEDALDEMQRNLD